MGEAVFGNAQNEFAADLFESLPPRYDSLAEVLSFGQNRRWRRELVSRIAAGRPVRVLDVASGTAGVAIALARATEASIVGVDISEPMLQRGRRNIAAAGLGDRIELEAGRAESLRFEDRAFDAVSFTYLLRYVADPITTMRELARVVRPGGVIASLDFFVPPNPVWRNAWRLYTRAVLPVMGSALGGPPWWRVGRFLGPNIDQHYARWPRRRMVEAWESAGVKHVAWRVMSLGGGLVMWGVKG